MMRQLTACAPFDCTNNDVDRLVRPRISMLAGTCRPATRDLFRRPVRFDFVETTRRNRPHTASSTLRADTPPQRIAVPARHARYRRRPPLRATSRLTLDGARPNPPRSTATNSHPPGTEISSRSTSENRNADRTRFRRRSSPVACIAGKTTCDVRPSPTEFERRRTLRENTAI